MIERYECIPDTKNSNDEVQLVLLITDKPDGNWCKYEDVQKLQADNEKMRKALDEIIKQHNHYATAIAINALKENTQ